MTPQEGFHGRTQVLQEACACIGGHLREPNEQNTQQSPAIGRSTALQFSHS